MKKIVLIGDSIRVGYDKYVRAALNGQAEVLSPTENCRFALYVLRMLHDWKKTGQWGDDVDVVHWNAGLWDTIEYFEDGPLTSIEHYVDIVKRIDKRIKLLFPNAKIIFATSTPVLEDLYADPKTFFRYNAVTEKYNAAAVEVLSELGEDINDLYSLVKDVPREYYSDMTHLYTREGTKLLGDRVLERVCRAAGLPVPTHDEYYEEVKEIIGI